ncbi:oxygen-independent coproporphyrinogen III oxidase [Clostridium sp. 19966]|uniref:radical SAM family heme chaperone HemW n=1 Tax=Clostridium sp. 19966 TaxID=2768166 RepID=UPI0028DEC962|nr:radical SAM family heme chaperone HemW [Clostridium sp. 19966]MDT8715305.1 oxygen-independent coproporphyrinogen III oxidase [Clostridium sp. 19966]
MTGLYVHIPFCKSKCAYCDFCSYSNMEEKMLNYSQALCKEIMNSCKGEKIDSIFVGGGTPTYLSLEGWKNLSEAFSTLDIAEGTEFTVECNPGSVDEEKLKLFKKIGVNRISIGLQAWQNKILKDIGRIHTIEEFIESYKLIRKCGFDNINADIIFGLPNQTVKEFKETLNNLTELQPEHISCYSLIVEEGTPFYRLNNEGKLKLPKEDKEREMYEAAINILKSKGYKQYEISNFSKEGYECKHNIKYWKLQDYIGCGTAAHSYINKKRYRNEAHIERYIIGIKSKGSATVETINNTNKDDMEEFMFMGLRMLEGISMKEFRGRFKKDFNEVYGDITNKFCDLNLMKVNGDKVFLTHDGIQVSNSIMCEYLL